MCRELQRSGHVQADWPPNVELALNTFDIFALPIGLRVRAYWWNCKWVLLISPQQNIVFEAVYGRQERTLMALFLVTFRYV